MSSIGPQIPSQHSSKRKRTPEPDTDNTSSHTKHPRHNADEIALDDSDSEDDCGPLAPGAGPAAPTVSKPALGPTLPPTASIANKDEIGLDDSDSDSDVGPAPPPLARRSGPMPTTTEESSEAGSSSEDDYGPALPNKVSRRGPIGPFMPPTDSSSSTAPVRDEWMLALPVNTGYSERDPTKLKARKFTSKPSAASYSSAAAGGGPGGGGISALWTETPEEKLKRLQDAVLGRSDGTGKSAGEVAAADARAREQAERDQKIAASIASHRGKSLYDEHQGGADGGGAGGRRSGKGGEEDDDPSKRAFDREKDMSLGSKMGAAQRRELVAKSANFGGRFQKGSFL